MNQMTEGRTVRWEEYASCSDMSNTIFFDDLREKEAESVCSACPVQMECIQEDLDWCAEYSQPVAVGYRGLSESIRTKANYHRARYNTFFLFDLQTL